MKVLYIINALTHYYNLVLSKLNLDDDVELVCISPKGKGAHVGGGVKQTRDGINFDVIELDEVNRLFLYSSFDKLADTIKVVKPDIIVVISVYLPAFLLEPSLRREVNSSGIKIILKDIPFRLLSYSDALDEIKSSNSEFRSLPVFVNTTLSLFKLGKVIRRVQLEVKKKSYQIVDAHVNYIEAYDLLESYGVDREKVFVMRNSPDTDLLFSVKGEIEQEQDIMPNSPYRLVHVGRLVAWKNVDLLIKSFRDVVKVFPDSELLIIGVGPEEDNLRELTNRLGLCSSVKFVGGVYEPKLLGQYLMSSSLYVLAGMGGISINDAMSFGLPILCSVCDGTEKFLVREGVNGRYFIESNQKDLTEKILWFFENLDKSREMGAVSTEIIHDEVNIHTVIRGYKDAFRYVLS